MNGRPPAPNACPAGTPLPNRLLYWFARAVFWLTGWTVDAPLPDLPKWELVVAPHTSYWDFFYIILAEIIVTAGFHTLKISWLGKHTLFRRPLGGLFRRLGGIPVDRSARHALVDQVVEAFRRREQLVIAVTPEGTRKRTPGWRTGFYYIALGAGVPMLLAFVDFKRKLVQTGPLITPSGDIDADLAIFRDFFGPVTARHPEKVGQIVVAPRSGER